MGGCTTDGSLLLISLLILEFDFDQWFSAMPPRRQSIRQTKSGTGQYDPEILAKRRKRHLDELERSNYTEGPGVLGGDGDEGDSRGTKGRARHTISDKRLPEGARKKKSTMNVRNAVLYKKNLSQWLDESGIGSLPASGPSYLTAAAPPARTPPRMSCSVCGYFGKYRCKRCGMTYCDKNCEGVHLETRCERNV
ncbi:hypothetical protein C8Q75DRAFT_780360, partial [Abortiporus biennis]